MLQRSGIGMGNVQASLLPLLRVAVTGSFCYGSRNHVLGTVDLFRGEAEFLKM